MSYVATDSAAVSHSGTGDEQALEFFATSIAAMAKTATTPQDILDDALGYFEMDCDLLLSNKAREAGYSDLKQFHDDLLCAISEQLEGLKYCHLTAAERAQIRLIQAL